MNNLIKIDSDSLCFFSSRDSIEESILNIKDRINTIITRTEATHFLLCLTGSQGWRYKIYPEYKQKRKDNAIKYPQKLKYLKTLKSFLIEEYNAMLIPDQEADDLVAYKYNLPEFEQMLSSCDKDVVHQIEGTIYNYQKDEFITTTKESGKRFLMWQLICGDSTDNIPGLKLRTDYIKKTYSLDNRSGVGESTANKILNIIESRNQNYAAEILKCYISKYEDEPINVLVADNLYRHGKTKEELGFEDYTLNRHLLQLQTGIGKYNKILENYDVRSHINKVPKIINQIEEF